MDIVIYIESINMLELILHGDENCTEHDVRHQIKR
jgi:hypothetical protein